LVLWAIGVSRVNTSAINGYGLLQALPLIYFTGIGLWAVSTALALARRESIGPRLLGYLIALVVMIHATAPIVYSQARYAGMYKHVGVVQFINLHGQLLHTVDIYQNWPGFFALSAMLDRVAGVSSPLAYAAWAQLFFNLLILLVLNFALQRFALTTRQRWFTLFLFVAANWVGQDYFAPQAIGFVLSVAIVGVAMRR
jgi:uncharacterized membrane protein